MKKLFFILFLLLAMIFLVGEFSLAATVLDDDFSTGLGNWTTGTNTFINTSSSVSIVNSRVEFDQQYDYIQSKSTFTGDFSVSVELGKVSGSDQCLDFIIELVGAPQTSGLLRLRYGIHNYYSINLGQASTLTTNDTGNCVDDAELHNLKEMGTSGSPYKGTATLTYKLGSIKFSFTHSTLGKIETAWVSVGDLGATAVRIWGCGANNAERYVDHVKIDSPSSSAGGLLIDSSGNLQVGAGGGSPLYVLGNIACTGAVYEGSSRSLKKNISPLNTVDALTALNGLKAIQYTYKSDPAQELQLGFIAEDVPDLVAVQGRKKLRPMDIITILTSVVQQQQKEIELLKKSRP